MKQIHCLFLDRKDIRAGAQMVADAAEGMKAGKSVLIFRREPVAMRKAHFFRSREEALRLRFVPALR